MIMPGSQLLWQMPMVLHLFIYPALRLWVSCHFPVLMLTHLSLHSTRILSPGLLPAPPSKTTLRPWIFFPSVKKQTRPDQENQTKITLFLFWKTQEKNLPCLQNLNLRTLISGWLPFPTCWNKPTLQGQCREPHLPKNPRRELLCGRNESQQSENLTNSTWGELQWHPSYDRWVPKCHLPKTTEKRHLEDLGQSIPDWKPVKTLILCWIQFFSALLNTLKPSVLVWYTWQTSKDLFFCFLSFAIKIELSEQFRIF